MHAAVMTLCPCIGGKLSPLSSKAPLYLCVGAAMLSVESKTEPSLHALRTTAIFLQEALLLV